MTPTRTGGPLTVARHDCGLSTEISYKTDAHGTELTGRKRTQLARLRREQARGRFQSKAERDLAHGLSEVRRIASGLGVADSTWNQAYQLFRSAQNEELLRGRSIESMAAACVFGACRCSGASRLLVEVGELARVASSRVENAYRILNTELGPPAPPATPTQFVPRIAAEVDCSDRVRRRAHTLAEEATDATVTAGVHPAAFAAACVYQGSARARPRAHASERRSGSECDASDDPVSPRDASRTGGVRTTPRYRCESLSTPLSNQIESG